MSPVPGSPPYGLTFESISPSEVNVTWQPPLIPNGVITHYSLELWNSSHYLNLTSPTNNLHITHLKKYAQYRIMVQAHTRVGPGNYSSEPLNITTLEDGETDGWAPEGIVCDCLVSARGPIVSRVWAEGISLNWTFLSSSLPRFHLSLSDQVNDVPLQVLDVT